MPAENATGFQLKVMHSRSENTMQVNRHGLLIFSQTVLSS